MKLSASQQRKLHRKLKVNASAENAFISMFLKEFRNALGNKIEQAKSIEEVDAIIDSIDIKRLNKYISNLSSQVLKRNNAGFSNVIDALMSGINQLQNTYKDRRDFTKALPKLIKDKRIYQPLMEKFEYNMSLIKDLPKTVYGELRKAYEQGKSFRGTEIERQLYERMGNRARLITRTESAKVNSALTEVRARSIGINAYVWSTSGDRRVRASHKLIDGVMFFWNDPPRFLYSAKSGKISEMVGGCGETPNCRCICLPVFEITDIQFPVKVANHIAITEQYVGINKTRTYISSGTLTTYTKQQFLEKYGAMFNAQIEG